MQDRKAVCQSLSGTLLEQIERSVVQNEQAIYSSWDVREKAHSLCNANNVLPLQCSRKSCRLDGRRCCEVLFVHGGKQARMKGEGRPIW